MLHAGDIYDNRKEKCIPRTTLILTILIYLNGSALAAPYEEWDRTFPEINVDGRIFIQQTLDGGYILASEFDYGTWIIKTDEKGTQQWSTKLAQTKTSYIHQNPDGSYISAGNRLAMIDANGNLQWNKGFTTTVNYFNKEFEVTYCHDINSVQQTLDGGYILAGRNSYESGNGACLVKTDSNGKKVWNQSFGGREGAYSVKETSDKGYIFAGYTQSYGFGGGDDVWLVKTDVYGKKEWDKILGGKFGGIAYSVNQTSDNGYVLAGVTTQKEGTYSDIWIVKTDVDGNMLWNKSIGGASDEWAYSVQQTADDGYIIAGLTRSYGRGNSDAWIVKIDAFGNEIWNMTFGRGNEDIAYSVQQTSDMGYILAGFTESGNGQKNAWIIKISTDPLIPEETPILHIETKNTALSTPKPAESLLPENTFAIATTQEQIQESRIVPAFEVIIAVFGMILAFELQRR